MCQTHTLLILHLTRQSPTLEDAMAWEPWPWAMFSLRLPMGTALWLPWAAFSGRLTSNFMCRLSPHDQWIYTVLLYIGWLHFEQQSFFFLRMHVLCIWWYIDNAHPDLYNPTLHQYANTNTLILRSSCSLCTSVNILWFVDKGWHAVNRSWHLPHKSVCSVGTYKDDYPIIQWIFCQLKMDFCRNQ